MASNVEWFYPCHSATNVALIASPRSCRSHHVVAPLLNISKCVLFPRSTPAPLYASDVPAAPVLYTRNTPIANHVVATPHANRNV